MSTDQFDADTRAAYLSYASPGTDIDVVHLLTGPSSIETVEDDALAVSGVLSAAVNAEDQDFHAIICDCFAGPGVEHARRLVDIPVVGAGQAALLMAAGLVDRFSIITTSESASPLIKRVAEQTGVERKIASLCPINIPVQSLHGCQNLTDVLFPKMTQAVQEYGAQAFVLGCTAMVGANELADRFAQRSQYVPVIDPIGAAMKWAEAMVVMHLCESRICYPRGQRD